MDFAFNKVLILIIENRKQPFYLPLLHGIILWWLNRLKNPAFFKLWTVVNIQLYYIVGRITYTSPETVDKFTYQLNRKAQMYYTIQSVVGKKTFII
jgi:hypothetical protein